MKKFRPDRRSPSCASVPASLGRVGAVVARGDVSQRTRSNERTVEERVEKPNRMTELLVHECDQAGPQWCNRTRPANHGLFPIDPYTITRIRIRISSDVGNTTALVTARVRRCRDTRRVLICRYRKKITDTATGGAIDRIFVPDAFGGDCFTRPSSF